MVTAPKVDPPIGRSLHRSLRNYRTRRRRDECLLVRILVRVDTDLASPLLRRRSAVAGRRYGRSSCRVAEVVSRIDGLRRVDPRDRLDVAASHVGPLDLPAAKPGGRTRRRLRGAVRWVRQNASADDSIFLDAGLIEAQSGHVSTASNPLKEYLCYPVSGPYEIQQNVTPIGRFGSSPAASDAIDGVLKSGQSAWVIVRRPVGMIDRERFGGVKNGEASIRGFGRVSVLWLPETH